eukprot:CAMPEP_0177273082 /NCGR_PEP_ID=MMETSP0367-20130122/66422_1 /TAXON_ID=447022 ORGANISM="Scrippsiella hangoei-like, Strain SHHI-4" /NCGR_SAMPLE_ID=MMETSP0367 /ASSEMBLY_ACC=CAM_ASM_000362 /LENGTH=76 /DNA_ID=CAMNT_0018729283 /DNA_START=133 /DNA_END=363 /DNA_ORIENTATION=+
MSIPVVAQFMPEPRAAGLAFGLQPNVSAAVKSPEDAAAAARGSVPLRCQPSMWCVAGQAMGATQRGGGFGSAPPVV